MANLSPSRALEAARVAREAGRLTVALKATEHVFAALADEPDLEGALALECEALARDLALKGASLGALGLWLRAQSLGRDQQRSIGRIGQGYPAWRPQLGTVGARKDALLAGASGAFWIDLSRRARILVLGGGITGEGTEPFARVLQLACEGVHWVFVDMAEVNYVGSAGLALAVKISEKLRARGGGVALFGLSASLRILVETLGLDGYLNPVEDLVAALNLARGG